MKIRWYKYILSYFYLVTVKKIPSDFNQGLCLQMEAGMLLLNTSNANYSYGNLKRVFEEVFELINLDEIHPQNLLLLGLGTGSILDIMQRQYGLNPDITAIEIDPAVIECLDHWPYLNLSKTQLIEGDAFEKIKNLHPAYELIIVDLFCDLDVPESVKTEEFIKNLKFLMAPKGRILINFIVSNEAQKSEFEKFQLLLLKHFKDITGHESMQINRVLELKTP